MTEEQGNMLIAEVLNLKTELVSLIENQQTIAGQYDMGFAVGIIAGLLLCVIWAVTYKA